MVIVVDAVCAKTCEARPVDKNTKVKDAKKIRNFLRKPKNELSRNEDLDGSQFLYWLSFTILSYQAE